MANITPDYLRGFLIPSISISKDNLWDAQSNYTQANARSGIPEAQSEGINLTLSSIGTQAEKISIETIQGGLPGEAQYKWSGEDSIELGQDPSYLLTEAGYWLYSSSIVSGTYENSDSISSIDGTVWVVSEKVTSANVHYVQLSRQEKNGAISIIHTFVALPGTFSTNAYPAITRMQDGSLLVAYFQYTAENNVNIRVERSIDNGDTWKQIASRGFKDSIYVPSYAPRKMRMISVDNTVVLFLELEEPLAPNHLAQYVSRDGGTTFSLVDGFSEFGDGAFHQSSPITLPDGSIGIAYIKDNNQLYFMKIPNPGIRASAAYWLTANDYQINNSITFALKSTYLLSGGNVTTHYHDGVIWVIAQQYGNGRLYGFYSDDFGVSWNYASGSSSNDGLILDYASNTDRLTNLSSCVHEGRVKIFGHELNSIWYLALSGYSSFSYPARSDNPDRYQYLRWESTYIPVMTPSTSSQYTTIGTGSQSLDDEGLDLSTTGNTRYYRYSRGVTAFTLGQVVRLRMQVDQNSGGVTANYIAIVINQDDAVNSASLTLRFGTTSIQVRDRAGTKATITHDMTENTEIVIAWTNTDARIYYRTADGKQAKKWNLQTISGITLGASGLGNNIEWGHLAFSGVLNFRSHWQEVYITTGAEAGLFDFSTLRGAKYPPLGEYQYIDAGLAITAKDAPARGEDLYSIEPRYDYGIENIFHKISLSPRVVWRSAANTNQEIPLFVDPVVQATERSLGCSDMFGLHLNNINFQKFDIKIWSGSTWQIFASVDTAANYTSTYIKKGNTLISNSSTKDFLLRYGEAIGWRAVLYDPIGKTYHPIKIKMNSEGIWTTNTAVKQAVIQYDTTLTAPSSIPTSGNIYLLPSSITFLKSRLDGVNLGQYAFSISIKSQPLLEDYFQIGSMIMGSVAFPAPQYQRGRAITYSPNIQSQETLDGMFFSRKMSEGRRTASIAWTEPIDTTKLVQLNPDYWQVSSTAGARPVANYGDPYLMEGIFRYLSNREPLVYLPSIQKNPTNDQILITSRDMHMLCRTSGEVSVESVIGEENISEMFRVATVNLEEIE